MPSTLRTAILILLATGSAAAGQQALLGPGAAFISMGAAHIETSELDARLKADGYPIFGQRVFSAGIGGYRVLDSRFLLGAEITGLAVGRAPHLGGEVTLAGGYATIGLGYVKQLSRRLRFYPRFGLGAGGITLSIRNADTLTFDSILASPEPVVNHDRLLSTDGGVVDLGVGLEFLPKGWLLGVRAGVIAANFPSDWWTQTGQAFGGPKASIAGPYIRATVGGAWKR